MSWIESTSPSFACRHSSARATDAARVLVLLERTRERLLEDFGESDLELTVVLHDSPHALALSNPLLPPLWGLTARPVRRYVAGWVGDRELHVLSPQALRERAAGVPGSFEMLALAPASLYARRLIIESNRELSSARPLSRGWQQLRWAWLVDGAARWLSGESGHARGVLGGYMRAGHRPHFPPRARDAALTAPPLIDLLSERHGRSAVTRLIGRLHTGGAQTALAAAFQGQSLSSIETEWRSRLRRLADGT
jgi:hypothetical protein